MDIGLLASWKEVKMYKTALVAAPFNTETTREVGGRRGAGCHGSNSPA